MLTWVEMTWSIYLAVILAMLTNGAPTMVIEGHDGDIEISIGVRY